MNAAWDEATRGLEYSTTNSASSIFFQLKTRSHSSEMLHSRSEKQTARRWGERDSLWSFNQRLLKVLGEMIICFNSFLCSRWKMCGECLWRSKGKAREETKAERRKKFFHQPQALRLENFSCYYFSLFVLQIIQSRKCVFQKLLRPFLSRAEEKGWGGWKCLQRRNLINQWLNKEIEKVRKARKFIRRWIEEGGHEAINFNIYFYRGGFKIWLELRNWSSLLIRSFHGCRRLVCRRCYLIKTNQCSETVIVGVESLKFERKKAESIDLFSKFIYPRKQFVTLTFIPLQPQKLSGNQVSKSGIRRIFIRLQVLPEFYRETAEPTSELTPEHPPLLVTTALNPKSPIFRENNFSDRLFCWPIANTTARYGTQTNETFQ